MRAVLDASVAVKWVLPERDTPKAVRLRNEYRLGLHELLAPDIFPVEVSPALTKAERKGIIQPPLATRRLANVLRSCPGLRPYLPLLPRAAALSSRFRVGVYDCLYLIIASQECNIFITGDQRLINWLKHAYSFIVDPAAI